MKKLLFNNTYKSGSLTYFAFRKDKNFTGVCLELDLIVSGSSLKDVKEKIEDLSHLWVENIIENKLSEELLNKPAPTIYWKMFERAFKQTASKIKIEQGRLHTSVTPIQNSFFYALPYSNNQISNFGFA